MQIQPKIPVFSEVSHSLLESESTVDPAEMHGILCGLICIEQGQDGKSWFNAILKLLEAREQFAVHRDTIINFYEITYQQLSGITSEFQLILPNEKTTFAERAAALSRWCRGFIYGLGLANKSLSHVFSEESYEVLHCMHEIAKLDFDQIDVDERDRQAYESVAEFVRNSVVLIYFECVHAAANVGKESNETELFEIYPLH